MDQNEKDIDIIEAFYQNKLKGNELASFIQRRKNDPAFDEEVEDYVLIFQGIEAQGKRNFIENVQSWEAEIEKKPSTKTLAINQYLAIAASVLILLISIMWLFFPGYFSKNNDELFLAYFQPYDDVVSVRSNQSNYFEQGMNAYNEQSYDKAIEFLKLVKPENPQKNAAELYLGISYLAIGETENAATIFKPMSEDGTGLFKEIAEWNLALTYLKKREELLLNETLQNIITQKEHIYKQQAEDLKRDLD